MSWDENGMLISELGEFEMFRLFDSWFNRNHMKLYRFFHNALENKQGELKVLWNETECQLQIVELDPKST